MEVRVGHGSAAAPAPLAAARRLLALLVVLGGLALARPVPAAAPVTDAEAAQDLARAETLIGLGDYDEAVAILSALSDRGYVRAAVRLADLLYDEIALADAPTDTPEQRQVLDLAVAFYREATAVDGAHYDRATRRLARLLLFREDDPAAVRGAVDQLRRLAALGSGPAAYDLGRAYTYGRGVVANAREAERFLRLAIDLGEYRAARLFGLILTDGINRPAEPDVGLEYLQLALDHGDYEAATYIGAVHARRGELDRAVAVIGTAIGILEEIYTADPQPVYAMRLAAFYLQDPYWPQDQAKGIAWLERAAADNTGLAAYRLFQLYAAPDFGLADPEAAWTYAERVVETQYWAAVPGVAYRYLTEACAAPEEAQAAVAWLERAADGGDPGSMHVLAQAYTETWPCVPADPAAAQHWMVAAAVAGWGENEDIVDEARRALDTASDAAERDYGLALLRAAADRNSTAARIDLGEYLVEHGAGPDDRARGLDQLRAAATGESGSRAMSTLGRALLYSADPAQREEGLMWMTRAAGYGRPDALRMLGTVYMEGLVAPADPARAERLLAQALALGNGEAGLLLADLYIAGLDGEVDFARAHAVLEQAVALGSAEAMVRLSEMYRLGLGVERQPERAAALLDQAAAAGNREAQILLESAAPPLPVSSSHEG